MTGRAEGPRAGRTGDDVMQPAAGPLVAEGLTIAYGDHEVVHGVDLAVPPGRITVVVGPNGCGKSTLLRAMARLVAPTAGRVLLAGEDVRRTAPRTLARRLGILPQHPVAPDGVLVADLVARGRHPHRGRFARPGPLDDEAVAQAMLATGVDDLADRRVEDLSGGQRQRVWIAMALAQRTDVLLLDEPTTFLDLGHQLEVLDLLVDLNTSRGTTVVAVLHDLNLAARYADHLVAVHEGRVAAAGAPMEVVTERLVADVFGVRCRVEVDPVGGGPLVVPAGRHHAGRIRAGAAAAVPTHTVPDADDPRPA